ncbi:MAG: 50S ribosomal protein L17 [Candidatus Pacebacteria bacterium]|nr:50S ribosomal protein L17 [Candidatus Paceibacterota bacterium]
MRKKKKGRKLKRKRDQRKALLKSLAEALIEHERIKTTFAKAKELQPFVEKLTTKAKKRTLAKRREVLAILSKKSTKKLFDEIAPRYKERQGGYTRILKLPPRKSDGSKMVIIEFVK